jgi:hypothetical protein
LTVVASGEVVLTDAVAVNDPGLTARAVTERTAAEPLSSVPAVQVMSEVAVHPGDAETNVSAEGREK